MMKKTVLPLIYIGFSLGFILGVILTTIIATLVYSDGTLHPYTTGFLEYIGNPLLAFLIHSIVCGLLGVIMLTSALFYEIEEWYLLKATLLQFLVIIAGFYLTAFFLRWFAPSNTKAVCTSMIIFILAFSVIWFSQYLSCIHQVKDINQRLDKKKNEKA